MDENNQPSATTAGGLSMGTTGDVGGRKREFPPPVTLAILVVCGAVWAGLNFLPKGEAGSIGDLLAPSAVRIWEGAYWALVTSAFVHINFIHALFNMWWTKDFGRLLEPQFGMLRFVLFVVCSAIVSSGWQLGISNQTGIGFSGVVYAFFGYMLAARNREPVYRAFLNVTTIRWMLGWLVLCIVLTLMKVWNIANTAHFAGFIFGSLIGVSTGSGRFVLPARIGVAVMGACALVPVFYMPWSDGWRFRDSLQKYAEYEELARRGDPEGQYYHALVLFERAKAEQDRSGRLATDLSAVEKDAMALMKKSAEQGYVAAMNELAWKLATDSRAAVRNGREAVNWAEKACEKNQWVSGMYIDTLAAAYAELRRWEEAIEYQKLAIAQLKPEEAALKPGMEKRLAGYRGGIGQNERK
jgi:membrane associated rhomboid family serine protease